MSKNKFRIWNRISAVALVLLFGLVLPLSGVFSYTREGVRVNEPARVDAATASTLNMQGRLYNASGSTVADGYYNLEFKIYNHASAGAQAQGTCSSNCLWVETRDYNGGSPDNRVRTVNGYFSVNLGSIAGSLPTNIDWSQDLWITMRVGGTGTSPSWEADEMSPRIKLTAVPYALVAGNVRSGNTNSASTHSDGVNITTGDALGSSSNTGSIKLQTGDATDGNSGNITLDVGTASGSTGTISIGTANTSGITIGHVGVATDIGGNLTVSGSQFTNNGSTLNGVGAFPDQDFTGSSNTGTLGTAATTVDVHTAITIDQDATPGQNINLAAPTDTTPGRVVYVLNIGTHSFTMNSVSIPAGYGQLYIWNGSDWRLAASGGGAAITLQAAYDSGNTITTTNNRNIAFTLADTALDADFIVDIASGSTGEFKVQNNGSDVLQIGSSGQLQLDVQGNTGGLLIGGDAALYRSAADTLQTESMVVGNTFYTLRGSDITDNGQIDDLALASTSLIRLTGTSPELTGIANGSDGRILTIINDSTDPAVIHNNSNSSSAGNRILTGTSANLTMPSGSSVIMIYDSGDNAWRVVGSAAISSSGAGAPFVQGGNSFGDHALLGTNDAFNLVFKTNGNEIAQLTTDGNLEFLAAATVETNAGALTVDSADALNLGTANATSISIGKNGITTTNNGALTVTELLTGNAGATISGAAINLNHDSNNQTNINTGSSTGAVNIGNSGAGAISLDSGAGISLDAGAASNFTTSAGDITIQAGSGTVSLGSSTALTASGALTVSSGGTSVLSVDTGGAAALNVGTTNANAISVGRSGVTTTVNGSLTVTELGTFNGGLTIATGSTFTNASSTLLSAIAISDHPSGGDIGTAANTVDVATTFNIVQTTAGQILTLPDPTVATAGRIVYINSLAGNATFTMYGVVIAPGTSASFIWNGTAWVATGGGSGVNTIGTIDGQTKSANGAVIQGSTLYLQTADEDDIGLVSTEAQNFAGDKTFIDNVEIQGGSLTTNQTTFNLLNTTATTINFGGEATAINIGASDSALTIQGGNALNIYSDTTGALTLDSGSTGDVNLGTGANAKDIYIGNTTGDTSVTIDSGTGNIDIGTGAQARSINIGTGAADQTVTIGSTNTTSGTTIQSGSDGTTISSTGGQVTVQSSEAATDAIYINASDADGGLTIVTGNGGITMDTTAGISLDAATSSNLTVNGEGESLTVAALGGGAQQLILQSAGTGADAVRIQASGAAGGIDIDAGTGGVAIDTTGGISLDAGAASNFTTSAGDITIQSGSGTLNLNAGTIVGNATSLNLFNSVATTINFGGAATTLNIGTDAGSTHFNGGSASTGCSIDGTTGSLVCSGDITTTSTTGTVGFWSRDDNTGTLQPATAGDHIQTSGSLSLTSDAGTNGSGITFGSSGETKLYRSAANILQTDGWFVAGSLSGTFAGLNSDGAIGVRSGSATDIIFDGGVVGDANLRFTINANGELSWGDGTNPADTNLYRAAPGGLYTDNAFGAGSIIVANSGTASEVLIGDYNGAGGSGILFYTDTNLYRSNANELTTGGAFIATGLLTGNAGATISGGDISLNATSNFDVNIGNSGDTGNAVNIQAGTTGGINIGTVGSAATGSTIHIADTTDGTGIQGVTIGSTANASNHTTIQGGANGGVNIFVAGANNNGVIVRSTGSDSTSAFQIQDSSSVSMFTADTANARITIGGASTTLTTSNLTVSDVEITTRLRVGSAANGISFNDGTATKLRFTGTARNSIALTLSPEYAGATMTGSGIGIMTSDFCSDSLNINDAVGEPCNGGGERNYYSWTTDRGSAQSYDIFVKWRVPSNFGAFDSTPIQFNGFGTSGSDSVQFRVYSNGTQCDSDTVTGSGWSLANSNPNTSCSPAAGDELIFRITLTATNGNYSRVGDININYLSVF